MKLAVLLLCHDAPELVAARLDSPFFRHPDIKVYLHYDGKCSAADFADLCARLAGRAVHVLRDRVECHWGTYSLVDATQRMMDAALADADFKPDYLALISGACIPFRPFSSLQEFLRRRRGIDFIEAHDISTGKWVKGGLEKERYEYVFPFKFQTQRRLFDLATSLQSKLKISRKVPDGLKIHFGSQWFCLTRDTAEKIRALYAQPNMVEFFRRSWIPDEFAFPTLVAAVQKPEFIARHNLTYYEFGSDGLPLVLENDHLEHLLRQPFFFARKVAPGAAKLSGKVNDYIGREECDLSYFDRVGKPTRDYRLYCERAAKDRTVRSCVGINHDPFRGSLDGNRRKYFVLYSSSVPYLRSLLAAARGGEQRLPILDMVFDPTQLVPARELPTYYGIQPTDLPRRDYDPVAFLHELVNVDPDYPLAFGIDPTIDSWIRNFVVWDTNAVLIDCDPPNLVRKHFQKVKKEKKYTCRFMALRDIPNDGEDPVLNALRIASGKISPVSFFRDEEVTLKAEAAAKPPRASSPQDDEEDVEMAKADQVQS